MHFLFFQINAASLGGALKPETGPWLDLSEKLAKVASSLFHNKKILKTIVITYGTILKDASRHIIPSVLMGLISSMGQITDDVNLINAEYFAKEMGLKVYIRPL